MTHKSTRYRKVEPAALNRRAVQRHAVEVTSVSLNGRKKSAVPASLVDISIYGCRLNLDAKLNENDAVEINLATFHSVSAKVVWTKAGEAGCRFLKSLDTVTLRALTITH